MKLILARLTADRRGKLRLAAGGGKPDLFRGRREGGPPVSSALDGLTDAVEAEAGKAETRPEMEAQSEDEAPLPLLRKAHGGRVAAQVLEAEF